MTLNELVNDAHPCPFFGASSEYLVEHKENVSYVCTDNGYNALRFKSRPGAVFAYNKELAEAICRKWNGETV